MSKEERSKPKVDKKIKVERTRRRLYDQPDASGGGDGPGSAEGTPEAVTSPAGGHPAHAEPHAAPDAASRAKLLRRARKIVERHSFFSSGTAVLPLPLLDMAYLTGVQLKMLSELSRLYGVTFRRNRGKALVASLASGLAAHQLTSTAIPRLLRYLPGVGFLVAPAAMVFFSTALTWAVGKVFIQHFEAGGTLLDFNPEAMNDYFMERFREKYRAAN